MLEMTSAVALKKPSWRSNPGVEADLIVGIRDLCPVLTQRAPAGGSGRGAGDAPPEAARVLAVVSIRLAIH